MLALIFTRATLPMAIGSSAPARWWMLAGMMSRPIAISSRTSSGVELLALGDESHRVGDLAPTRVMHLRSVLPSFDSLRRY